MTYKEVQRANADSLQKYNSKSKTAPYFKFTIHDVDLTKNACVVNGEYSNIQSVLVSILNRKICVTNLRSLSKWAGFDKPFEYYSTSVLNKPSNRVLFATTDFYTQEGQEAIVQDCLDNEDYVDLEDSEVNNFQIMDDYEHDEYYDLCTNMNSSAKPNDILVLMRIKRWNGVHCGYKIIKPRDWRDVFGSYGCDGFAYYVDRYNLHFIGYHHDSDGTPNTGIIREIKPGVQLTDNQLTAIMNQFEVGETSDTLTRLTRSLKPYFTKVYGF